MNLHKIYVIYHWRFMTAVTLVRFRLFSRLAELRWRFDQALCVTTYRLGNWLIRYSLWYRGQRGMPLPPVPRPVDVERERPIKRKSRGVTRLAGADFDARRGPR